MRDRCTHLDGKDYPNYKGRGITVCTEWMDDFEALYSWALSHAYRDDLTLDRIDNDGPYTPDNCQWATYSQQNRNSRRTRMITIYGVTKSLVEWVEDPRCAVSYSTFYQCAVRLGWPPEDALLNHV